MSCFQAVRFLGLHNFFRFVWQQSLDSMEKLPSITAWGYTELYQPLWTTLPETVKKAVNTDAAVRQLV